MRSIGIYTYSICILIGKCEEKITTILKRLCNYRDFLPRGTGMVTKLPLILQLINTPDVTEGKNLQFPLYLLLSNIFIEIDNILIFFLILFQNTVNSFTNPRKNSVLKRFAKKLKPEPLHLQMKSKRKCRIYQSPYVFIRQM